MEYYKLVNYYLKILTAVLLIYYFNPLSNVSVKPFYRSMVFSAGTFFYFLLLSVNLHTLNTKNVVTRTTH